MPVFISGGCVAVLISIVSFYEERKGPVRCQGLNTVMEKGLWSSLTKAERID